MTNKFNKLYYKIINEQIETDIINEGFIGDVGSGAAAGATAGAALGAVGGTAVGLPAPMAAGAGMMIGLPVGALIGTTIWLKNLIADKICKKEDEKKIDELIKKIDDRSFSLKDNEELEKIGKKYRGKTPINKE